MGELVSIIVPVYNYEKYLSKCVDSFLCQTYSNIEIILVDDGSTDGSGAICDEYQKKHDKIRVIHKPNGGVSSARNAGIDAAKGEWVTFCDSDDWFETCTVEKLVATQGGRADIVIPRSRMLFCKPNGEFEKYVYNDDDFDLISSKETIGNDFEKLRDSWALYSTCGRLYRRRLLTDHGIKFDTTQKVLEDFCFNVVCIEAAECVIHISDVLYNFYVLGVENYAYKRKYQDYIISIEKVYDAIKGFNDKHNMDFSQGQYDFIMSYWLMALDAILLHAGSIKERNKSVKDVLNKVSETDLYAKCTKGYLDRHFQVLFEYKSVTLFAAVYKLKQFKKRLKK